MEAVWLSHKNDCCNFLCMSDKCFGSHNHHCLELPNISVMKISNETVGTCNTGFLQDKGRVDKKFIFTSFPLLILQGLCLSIALLFNAADTGYLPCDFWGWIVSWMCITNNSLR